MPQALWDEHATLAERARTTVPDRVAAPAK
jgi:hypothetical protein